MRLRQVVLVARDLERTNEVLRKLLSLGPGYRDPGVGSFGLVNTVFAVGDTFLEVVSPDQEGTTAGRFLEKRGGDGGYMVIVQTADLGKARERFAEHGLRTVWDARGEGITGVHLHPRDVGGAILSIDEAEPPESWGWAGSSWEDEIDRTVVRQVVAVEIEAHDPEAMAARWAQALGAEAQASDGAHRVELSDGEVRFRQVPEEQAEGVAGFDFLLAERSSLEERARELDLPWIDEDTLEVVGTRFRFL